MTDEHDKNRMPHVFRVIHPATRNRVNNKWNC